MSTATGELTIYVRKERVEAVRAVMYKAHGIGMISAITTGFSVDEGLAVTIEFQGFDHETQSYLREVYEAAWAGCWDSAATP